MSKIFVLEDQQIATFDPNAAKVWRMNDKPVVEYAPQATAYLHDPQDAVGTVFLSPYSLDRDLWETNHVEVKEPRHNQGSSLMNILRNILTAAGVNVVME